MSFQGLDAMKRNQMENNFNLSLLILSISGRIFVHLNQFLHHMLHTAFVLEHQMPVHLCIIKSLVTGTNLSVKCSWFLT
jgi:hypothetical protein